MHPALYREDYELLYKEDYPKARRRIEAFCELEVLDRVCLSVTAPRNNVRHGRGVPEFPSNELRHTDIDFVIEFHNARFGNIFWGGEAMPVAKNELGFVSSGFPRVTFRPESPWGHPWLPRSSPDVYQFDPENRWWRQTYEIHMALLEDSQGKYFPGEPALLPPMDMLAIMRGPGELCLDMMDQSEGVHAILDHLTQVHQWRLERVYRAMAAEHPTEVGSSEWRDFAPRAGFSRYDHPQDNLLLPPWCHKFRIQCDFAALVGPEHFREFVLPELTYLADFFERVEYHLDGSENLCHLPVVLEIDKVNYVQWAPRPGDPQGLYWREVWETIRASGRGMQMNVPYEQVEKVIREWGPKGLWVVTAAPTEEDARDLLKNAERWSCRRPWDVR